MAAQRVLDGGQDSKVSGMFHDGTCERVEHVGCVYLALVDTSEMW